MDSRFKLVCLFASILIISPCAIAQNNAISLSSSQSVVTDPNHFIGSNGALAGFFHHNRKLDFLYGGRDHSRSTPSDYWYLATNNGNGTFTTTSAPTCDYVPNFSTDLDGDGIWDIWCSNYSIVEYGDGNGGLGTFFNFPTGFTADELIWDFKQTSDISGRHATMGGLTCPSGTVIKVGGSDRAGQICNGDLTS